MNIEYLAFQTENDLPFVVFSKIRHVQVKKALTKLLIELYIQVTVYVSFLSNFQIEHN